MIDFFKNNDKAYIDWCTQHKRGFVFNHFGGRDPTYNVIHQVQCRFLWRDKDEGKRTVVEKWCSADLDDLFVKVEALRGGSYKCCSVCIPSVR